MSTTVEQWKAQMESDVRSNIDKYIAKLPKTDPGAGNDLSLKSMDYKEIEAQSKLTFASDELIQRFIDGYTSIDGLCCLVCLETPFGKSCISPHLGSCNMC